MDYTEKHHEIYYVVQIKTGRQFELNFGFMDFLTEISIIFSAVDCGFKP